MSCTPAPRCASTDAGGVRGEVALQVALRIAQQVALQVALRVASDLASGRTTLLVRDRSQGVSAPPTTSHRHPIMRSTLQTPPRPDAEELLHADQLRSEPVASQALGWTTSWQRPLVSSR